MALHFSIVSEVVLYVKQHVYSLNSTSMSLIRIDGGKYTQIKENFHHAIKVCLSF
jgi:hypothetical protein